MRDINTVALSGRLTREAELKYTHGGLAICEFGVAVNRSVKKGEEWVDEPSFIDCTLFGRFGESLAQYLQKGTQVMLDGELRQDRWQNKEGQNRSKVSVVVQNIVLGRKPGGAQHQASHGEFSNDFDEDVPFD